MYDEEFDNLKTKMLKYIMYKKRTEKEIRQKFANADENMVDDVIEYLCQAGYIDDTNYVKRSIQEFINIHTLSIKEIKYKLISKGVDSKIIEDYIATHYEEICEYEKQCAKKIYYKKSGSMELIEIYAFLRKKGYREDSIKAVKEEEQLE